MSPIIALLRQMPEAGYVLKGALTQAFLIALFASLFGRTTGAITLTPVVTGLTQPLYVTSEDSTRLFIVEQAGTIRIFDGTSLLATPFLDISALTTGTGERGLLGLAFHPNYALNGRFFIYYTNLRGHIELAELRVSSDPNVADPSSMRRLLLIAHSRYPNHNGGQIAFGPDGFLYVGTGDGGGPVRFGGRNAQNLRSLLGKILRIDVNSPERYAIPPDNPFVNVRRSRKEIWALGLRNPWRFSFDTLTGTLIAGDVGAGAWEEVDFIFPGGNYGWPVLEGARCLGRQSCRASRYIPPISEYPHVGGRAAIIGGFIYRGSAVSSLQGRYIFGDFGSGELFSVHPGADGIWVTEIVAQSNIALSSIGRDSAGEPLLVDLKGAVYRLGE